jgi:hypothetical protein
LNKLYWTDRIKKDIEIIAPMEATLRKQQPHLKFYATGHSLGGAVCDILLAHNYASLAVSYNPAIEPQYKHHSHNHRIYNEWDPLYAIMGRFATTYQVRRGDKKPRTWAEYFASMSPWGAIYTKAMGALYAHNLDRFTGGGAKKAKNALYGGVQCHTFTEDECIAQNGIFDADTQNCFVNGENLGEKDCDNPAPPTPFKPVPYEPGKPGFKPVPYEPGKPDGPPAPFVPPPNGYRPDLKPDDPNPPEPVPGTDMEFHPQCYMPDKVSEEATKINQKQMVAQKFDVRRNIVKAKIINENLRRANGHEAGIVGSTDKCRFYVKEDGSYELVGDTSFLGRCNTSGSVSWNSADDIWNGKGAELINASQKSDDYIRSRLTQEGWLDTKYLQKEVSKSEYLSRIPEWARAEASAKGKTGNCAPRDTPAQIYDKCVKEGYPNWTEATFNAERNKLFKHHASHEWDPTINYQSYTCVRYNGVSYQAKGPTPKGRTPGGPGNDVFWVAWLEDPPRQAPIGDTEPDFSAPLDKPKADKFIADYGTTFQEFQRKRDETCNSIKEENEIKSWDEWWEKIGSKYNKPCQPHRDGTNDPLAFNNTIVDLDRPVCRQWRADATNLTNMLPPGELDKNGNPTWMDYEHRIPQDKWLTEIDPAYPEQRRFVKDDKTRWVWRSETTTPRHLGKFDMPVPGGCDFPPLAGTPEGRDELAKMAPEECFQKQRSWAMLMKANKASRQCAPTDITCNVLNGAFPFLTDLAINGLRDFVVGLIPGGDIAKAIVNKLIKFDPLNKADKLDGFIGKKILDPLVNKAVGELLNLLKTKFNTSGLFDTSAEDQYLARFDEDKDYPGYYDPVLEEDIPAQKPDVRQMTLMRRLIDSPGSVGPDGKYNQHTPYYRLGIHPTDYDAIGYDVEAVKQTNAQGDFTPVRPPVATGGAKHSKYVAIANDIVKGLKDMVTAEIKRRSTHGGARPHPTFERHLISMGISPDIYLSHARQKAKSAGLAWKLIGFADDGKHKLQVPNEEGRLVSFGSAGMGDHILYKLLKDPTADTHRRRYRARATKIKGNWRSSSYSPNSLALAVLW